jgi:phosphoribosylformylglycinamidine synthase subunit PurS
MLAKVDPKHLRSESVARVVVDVMLKPEILDPQGQAVANALPRLGVVEVASVRIGRRIELEFDDDPDPATVHDIADRLLANPVIEDYSVTVDGVPVPRPTPPAEAPEPALAGQASADSGGSP